MQNINDFNMNQIIPVFHELKQCDETIGIIMKYLSDYKDFLIDIINNIMYSNVTNELKEHVDKNLIYVLNAITYAINQNKPLKKMGSIKTTIFERLSRGLIYRYKLNHDTFATNPIPFTIDNFKLIQHDISSTSSTSSTSLCIVIDDIIHAQFSNSNEYYMDDIDKNELIQRINNDIMKIDEINKNLYINKIKINSYIDVIKNDVIIFELFDPNNLI